MVLSGTGLLLAAVLLASPVSLAGDAGRTGPPDSAALARMDSAFAGGAFARVRGPGGSMLLGRVHVSEAGVEGQSIEPQHGAITVFERERRLVSWSEIERVEKRGSWAGPGAKLGAAAGLVLGVVAAANIRERWGGDMVAFDGGFSYPGPSDGAPVVERTIVIIAMPVLGAMLGGLTGSFVPRWRTVSP